MLPIIASTTTGLRIPIPPPRADDSYRNIAVRGVPKQPAAGGLFYELTCVSEATCEGTSEVLRNLRARAIIR